MRIRTERPKSPTKPALCRRFSEHAGERGRVAIGHRRPQPRRHGDDARADSCFSGSRSAVEIAGTLAVGLRCRLHELQARIPVRPCSSEEANLLAVSCSNENLKAYMDIFTGQQRGSHSRDAAAGAGEHVRPDRAFQAALEAYDRTVESVRKGLRLSRLRGCARRAYVPIRQFSSKRRDC